jgi:hypothetical protein
MYIIILSYHSVAILYLSVFDAKRLIGRKFDDLEVQDDIKHFPFEVFNKAGKPYIRVQYRGEEKEFVSEKWARQTDLCSY